MNVDDECPPALPPAAEKGCRESAGGCLALESREAFREGKKRRERAARPEAVEEMQGQEVGAIGSLTRQAGRGEGEKVDGEKVDGETSRAEQLPPDGDGAQWVDGLYRYRFRPWLLLFADLRGRLVHGTGGGCWSACEVLVDYLAARTALCRGAVCLELGAGLGAVGMSLAIHGASCVLLTDLPEQLPLTRRNVELNCLDPRVQTRALDWRYPADRVNLCPPQDARGDRDSTWDLIVASDVAYDPDVFEPLLATLASQASRNTRILLALADRQEEGEPKLSDFIEMASQTFHWELVHERRFEPNQSVTKVLQMKLRLPEL